MKETIKLMDFITDVITIVPEYKFDGIDVDETEYISHILYDYEVINNCNEFTYEFVDMFTKKSTSGGYNTYIIYRRKSDDKYFSYCLCGSKVSDLLLRETSQINDEIKLNWDV